MSTLTIRNLDNEVKRRLRVRAAERGVSMEQEIRDTLRASVAADDVPEKAWYDEIRAVVQSAGGVELELPPRESMREPPRFG